MKKKDKLQTFAQLSLDCADSGAEDARANEKHIY